MTHTDEDTSYLDGVLDCCHLLDLVLHNQIVLSQHDLRGVQPGHLLAQPDQLLSVGLVQEAPPAVGVATAAALDDGSQSSHLFLQLVVLVHDRIPLVLHPAHLGVEVVTLLL